MNREIARRLRQQARDAKAQKQRAQAVFGPRTRKRLSRRGRVL